MKTYKRMGKLVNGGQARVFRIVTTPGFIFQAKWLLKNISDKPWPATVYIKKKAGPIPFETMIINGEGQPGASIDLSVSITAPEALGKHKLVVYLETDDGHMIGKPLKVVVTVKNTEEQMMNLEDEISLKASELSKEGFGTFEKCYDALTEEKGNVEAATAKLLNKK